jgi:hypothetical protein
MDEKETFGSQSSHDFAVGDIVEWRTWDSVHEEWSPHYGILIETQNEFRSNRLVSISKVVSLENPGPELEFFTVTLRKLSSSESSGST